MTPETNTAFQDRRVDWDEVDLYRFFAAAFGAPTRERFEWMQQPALADDLRNLWTKLGGEAEFPGLGSYESYQDYESTYLALFDVGMPEPPIPLVESGHLKSQPAQQVALEVALFYDVLGLRADPAGYPLDHLVTQLEFLSAVRYACENASEPDNRQGLARLERDFLERHLMNWLPAVVEKLAREQPPFFWTACRMLDLFLRRRHAELKAVA